MRYDGKSVWCPTYNMWPAKMACPVSSVNTNSATSLGWEDYIDSLSMLPHEPSDCRV